MTYDELESLDETDGLVDGTANREIVDGDLAENTLGVNNEEATESDTLLLDEDTVVARDLLVPVGDQRELQVRGQTALLAGLGGPGEVGVSGISRHACNGDERIATAERRGTH